MKTKLREMKDNDIKTEILKARKEVKNFRFQYVTARSLENPKIIRNLKKKIARLLTIARERELGINTNLDKKKK
ncbi:MAG: 50S ribosomal protein L29 [Leptospiraceae bacterium]|nr:50S ribosomal protein L29 [Leptospiraceae bacterium]NUM42883.1 50S ribosomal protein L29 [Leptospiraceae bacterium]